MQRLDIVSARKGKYWKRVCQATEKLVIKVEQPYRER